MDEYISREAVLSRIYATHSTGGFANEEAYLWLHDEITNLSADVQPVKHGRWEHGECSVCGASPLDHVSGDMYVEVDYYPNYCPNCGSKNRMEGDSDDEP